MSNRVLGTGLSGILDLHLAINAHAEVNCADHHQHERRADDRQFNRDGAFYAPVRAGQELEQ